MLIPNSSAMDATSTCGGPITMLPQIVTGEPEQIWAHVEQLVQKAAQFASLLAQFEQAQQQLQKAWSGGASESAIKKVGDSLQAFDKIIKVVEEGGALLGISAGMVKTAQTAYQSVVSAVNPTVAGLMSNPWTYSAAVALSTGTSATLRGFIQTVQGLLSALGAGKLAQQIATLITIISEIEQLMNSGTGAAAGNTPGQQPTSPVIAPAPPNIVNPIGSTSAGVASNGIPTPAGAAGTVSPTGAGASAGCRVPAIWPPLVRPLLLWVPVAIRHRALPVVFPRRRRRVATQLRVRQVPIPPRRRRVDSQPRVLAAIPRRRRRAAIPACRPLVASPRQVRQVVIRRRKSPLPALRARPRSRPHRVSDRLPGCRNPCWDRRFGRLDTGRPVIARRDGR